MKELIIPVTLTKDMALDLFKPVVAHAIEIGNTEPLKVRAMFKALKEAVDAAEESEIFRNAVKDEVFKYPEGVTVAGVRFEKWVSGERLDYSGDPIVAELQKKIKLRQDLLKIATKNGTSYADTTTGVLAEPCPKLKERTETVRAEWSRTRNVATGKEIVNEEVQNHID